MANLQELVTRVQSLLDDPSGKLFSSDYIMGFVNQTYEDLYVELAAYDLTYDEQVTTLSAVPAQTSDLGSYQASTQALQYLLRPKALQWRLAGQTELDWKPVPEKDRYIDTAGLSAGIASYEWRAGIVFISPSANICDIRVRFEVIPGVLNDPADATIIGVMNIFAYHTSQLIAGIKGNDALAKYLMGQEMQAKENFESLQVKRTQSIRRRFARANPQRFVPWFRPPVG